MASILLMFSGFGFVLLLSAGILIFIYQKDLQIQQRVEVHLSTGMKSTKNIQKTELETEGSFLERFLKPIYGKYRHKMMEKMEKHTSMELEKRIRDAGKPFNWSPVDFRITQMLLAVGGFILSFLLFLPNSENLLATSILAAGVGGVAFIYPSFYLDGRKKDRIKLIEKSMPDFFDMLNLAIEAGMGMDQALSKVCFQFKGPLSEEMKTTLEDMRLGKSRRDAFIQLRTRIPSDHFQSIITSIIQADQLGVGMGSVLRSLTKRIREYQREKTREKAMKAPVTMLFPMVFFIFPALFIVILGPLAVHFITNGGL